MRGPSRRTDRLLAAAAAFLLAACNAPGSPPSPSAGKADAQASSAPGSTAPATAAAAPAPVAPIDPAVALKPSTLMTTAEVVDDGGEIEAPVTVKFSVAVQDGTGRPPYRHLWDFGDGTSLLSTEAKPTHVYRLPGNFRASVQTVDADGQYDQDWVDVMVVPNYEAMGYSPEEVHKRLEAIREGARKSMEAMQGGAGLPGTGGAAGAGDAAH
ncbi:MAG: PKD domain-containing protein [Alphaproteobacteria bacterium]